MISRRPSRIGDHEEGTWFVGQGHYVLEVLERFSSSMHYKNRNTPGELEAFSNNQKFKMTGSKNKSNIQEEHGIELSLSSIVCALMWIAFRTRPDICWAVTRVPRAVKTG
eukprot:12934754-Prorocentrum_lima.AAC.1